MNVHLEEIQKSLDMYLETKRNVFPRFYFLSNDDLLEILGQSKNPEAVQPHLKKCFDNIVRLKLHKVRDKNEASCMMSADGEEVDFQQAVLLEGAVEVHSSFNTYLCPSCLSVCLPVCLSACLSVRPSISVYLRSVGLFDCRSVVLLAFLSEVRLFPVMAGNC